MTNLLPLIGDLFNTILGARVFIKLDLQVAYNLIGICQGDERGIKQLMEFQEAKPILPKKHFS